MRPIHRSDSILFALVLIDYLYIFDEEYYSSLPIPHGLLTFYLLTVNRYKTLRKLAQDLLLASLGPVE